ncbi:hypothetical protein [Chondrinema litorale]|uniref:hypothetical protein n=1 Tax=Chondrinema litorale TaxID=2994555 RepID=UPI002543E03E|nr:hypothetical protein [Chondrinema litorale]UZR98679.1 hypothetical protein OQ292_32230 [Chondrinema litorale]
MQKRHFLSFFLFIIAVQFSFSQGLDNPLQNLPEGTVLTIREKLNVPAYNSVVEIGSPKHYLNDSFKSLSLVLHISSNERTIDRGTAFQIQNVEFINQRDSQEGTYKVKMYYGDKREYLLCYLYPEQSPKIEVLDQYFKIDLPKASSYRSN